MQQMHWVNEGCIDSAACHKTAWPLWTYEIMVNCIRGMRLGRSDFTEERAYSLQDFVPFFDAQTVLYWIPVYLELYPADNMYPPIHNE